MILTNPAELRKFHELHMKNAQENYRPWYFPVEENGKEPDAKEIFARGGKECIKCKSLWEKVYNKEKSYLRCSNCKVLRASWKAPHAQMTIYEATEHLKRGLNVGFASRKNDPSVIIDIDDESVPDLQKKTLQIQSRSRIGRHRIGFTNDPALKDNIPTGKGELRSDDAYIVAPGSYVPLSQENIDKLPEQEKLKAGRYTVEAEDPSIYLVFEDLPEIYKEHSKKKKIRQEKTIKTNNDFVLSENASKIYNLNFKDILPNGHEDRFPHPIHGSDTGKNFSINNENTLATCWRCQNTLTPIQYLATKAGYDSCENIGTPHSKGTTKYESQHKGDSGIIFYAWKQAKIDGLIPENDPIPLKALVYFASINGIVPKNYSGMIPSDLYNKTLDLLEVQTW